MKKKNEPAREERKSLSDYYKLHREAVNDLVTADANNSPPVSQKELDQYRSGPKIKLSQWVKAVLIKAWFAGAVCFFFLWGLGTYIPDQLDQMVVLGLALGVITDLMTNNIFRFYAKTPGENDRWMMFPKKQFATLPLNILYAFLLLLCVVTTYNVINVAILAATGAQDTVPLGVGPILFGVFTTAWDLLFLSVKRMAKRMLADAKKSARQGRGESDG